MSQRIREKYPHMYPQAPTPFHRAPRGPRTITVGWQHLGKPWSLQRAFAVQDLQGTTATV